MKRGLNPDYARPEASPDCPFCHPQVLTGTPLFPNGNRILQGESITFPNKFPFAAWHTVTVITRSHSVDRFACEQISDALHAQVQSLAGHSGYPAIIWNYLPSAGASVSHPHMQGLVDPLPSSMVSRYLSCGEDYLRRFGRSYWDDLKEQECSSPRFLYGKEIPWIASPVPLGEREVRAFLPIRHIEELPVYIPELAEGIVTLLDFYRSLGTVAFNMGIFFDTSPSNKDRGFRAFCSLIARMSPSPASANDSSAMERLLLDPVILTPPETVSEVFQEFIAGKNR
ncbi:MAG: galactose-1-phosphate uridylyltransferase [Methanoregulaceae archaeon]